jgi:hypothetical protein
MHLSLSLFAKVRITNVLSTGPITDLFDHVIEVGRGNAVKPQGRNLQKWERLRSLSDLVFALFSLAVREASAAPLYHVPAQFAADNETLGESPLQMNLLAESFSARASAPTPERS